MAGGDAKAGLCGDRSQVVTRIQPTFVVIDGGIANSEAELQLRPAGV